MSLASAALILAARDLIKETLISDEILKANSFVCEATCDGSPAGAVGQATPTTTYQGTGAFIGVHGGRERGIGQDDDFAEEIGISVTISIRTTHVPQYRVGDEVINNQVLGFAPIADRVKSVLHGELVLERANEYLDKWNSSSRFQVGIKLRFQNGEYPDRQSSDWFGAYQSEPVRSSPLATSKSVTVTPNTPYGLSKLLSFYGAQHFKSINEE